MSGISHLLSIARGALFIHQKGVELTGHNVANINTPGYSRQNLVLNSIPPTHGVKYESGRGVEATNILRSYDQFLGRMLIREKDTLGKWNVMENDFSKVEMVFNESDGYGLNQAIGEFFNAWHDLANNPESITERKNVQVKGQILSERFNTNYNILKDVQQDMNEEIKVAVDEINSLSSQIATLSKKIIEVEGSGVDANEERDQRNLLLERLAELIPINFLEDKNRNFNVLISGGKSIIADSYFYKLDVEHDRDNQNFFNIYFVGADGSKTDITSSITSGELGSKLQMRDTGVSSYIEKLDRLASAFVYEVNKIHREGYGIDESSENLFFKLNTIIGIPGEDNTGGAKIDDISISNDANTRDVYKIVFQKSSEYVIYNETKGDYLFSVDNNNNTILYNDGSQKRIEIPPATYTGEDLARKIETMLEEESENNQDYAVTFDRTNRKFNIGNNFNNSNSLTIYWNDEESTAASILGFNKEEEVIIQGGTDESDFRSGVYDYASGNSVAFSGITLSISNNTNIPHAEDTFIINPQKDAALNISLTDSILNDPNKIAAAQDELGLDNINALKIVDLQKELIMNNNTATFEDFHNSIVSEVGLFAQNIERELKHQENVVDHIKNRISSLSGVSLDEEMTNLIKYQQAYNAAAKLIIVSDEMLNTLLNIRR
ncbi:MAG: flagellar hook-associated protein FlgK [Thermodesulfobacteriota bacterium]|nr:flagellar hook-associated protein FlgK [Thermodesulfobacteriota bacterium]